MSKATGDGGFFLPNPLAFLRNFISHLRKYHLNNISIIIITSNTLLTELAMPIPFSPPKSVSRRALVLSTVLLLLAPAWALQPPTGTVILTISGKVGEMNHAGAAVFDLAMLEALPQRSFVTSTPWYKEPTKFTGPLLRDVLAAAKAQGTTLEAMAINDYKTSIPVDDARQFDVIVAHRVNDQPISVRTKGPLFIIYPFDTTPELKASKYYGRSAWQLKSLKVD